MEEGNIIIEQMARLRRQLHPRPAREWDERNEKIVGEGYSYVLGVATPAHTVKQMERSDCKKGKEAVKGETYSQPTETTQMAALVQQFWWIYHADVLMCKLGVFEKPQGVTQ